MVNSILLPSEACSALVLPCRPPPPPTSSILEPSREENSSTNGLWSGRMCAFHPKTPPRKRAFKALFSPTSFPHRPQLPALHPLMQPSGSSYSLSIPCSTRTSLFLKALYLFFTFIKKKNTLGALKPDFSYPPEYVYVEGINQVCQTLSCETFNISKRFKVCIFITCTIENNLSIL